LNQLGAKVVTLSDSSGFIHDPAGIDDKKLEFIFELKNIKRGRIEEYAEQFGVKFHKGEKPWAIKCDAAFPSATQNEIDADDAQALLDNGCYVVSEGANMPTAPEGVEKFLKAKILYGPGKAANAGGVATSGLEMSQNASRLSWTREDVDKKLNDIMKSIHEASYKASKEYGDEGNYVLGANIAGFVKV
ncbi:MAG: glutamate dehydrogenase, partial [Proteobacteria bacterium]|nr:glutamate dehydrogenase [Pseudomonadota bacterium]